LWSKKGVHQKLEWLLDDYANAWVETNLLSGPSSLSIFSIGTGDLMEMLSGTFRGNQQNPVGPN